MRTHPAMHVLTRRRPRDEEGFSLVEMLVAMVILMVVMTALLGAMIASAQSIVDQRARTAATRVGNEHLERQRAKGFEGLTVTTAGPDVTTVPADGRSYQVSTTVTETAAATPGMVVPAGSPTVKNVTSTVTWSAGGQVRSLTFATAVAQTSPQVVTGGGAGTPAKMILSITLTPNPSVVDILGGPLNDIGVTAVLSGFSASALVTLSWGNDGGVVKTQTLTSGDGGITWTGTIARTNVVRKILVGELSPGLTFTLRTGAGGPEQQYTLSLAAVAASPPVITSMTASPSTITLQRNFGSCSGGRYCNNVNVDFTATVSGVDPTRDSVRLNYTLATGAAQETALVFDAASGQWRLSLPSGSTELKCCGMQRFTFVVLRAGGGTTSGWVERNVAQV
ncbi:MAG: type II secretion system GspH family protein [Actinomycetota bacterium]|nr:type II secretion system GspH family protein [Actinomycetota bacterium]